MEKRREGTERREITKINKGEEEELGAKGRKREKARSKH